METYAHPVLEINEYDNISTKHVLLMSYRHFYYKLAAKDIIIYSG